MQGMYQQELFILLTKSLYPCSPCTEVHRFSQAKFQALSAWEPQEGAAKVRHLKLAISNRGSEDN